MPKQRFRHASQDYAPADRLARAIGNIDKRLEQLRLADQPIPLSAYRARRILQKAHARCEERGSPVRPSPCQEQAARTDAMPRPRGSRRDPVERCEALPDPPVPMASRNPAGCPASKPDRPRLMRGRGLAYDWTGEKTRRRKRLKRAATFVLALAVLLVCAAAPSVS